ncbi:MAG: endonuclease/exonuclease/phosphatase family protein, partial [Cetobacterium sp.]
MVNINILSLNVRGLNSPIKHTRVLDLMHRKKIDVAFLQEIHLTAMDTQRMQNRRYIPIISSCCKSKKQGVTILFKRNSNFIVEHKGSDDDGRVAYCCALIEGNRYAFVNIYAPNSYDASFFPQVLKTLLSLHNYSIVIGSDMNAVFDTALDRSNPSISVTQSHSSAALRLFSKDLDLCDAWRLQNPTAKEY